MIENDVLKVTRFDWLVKIMHFFGWFFFGKNGSVFLGYLSPVIRYIPLRGDAAAARFIFVSSVVLW